MKIKKTIYKVPNIINPKQKLDRIYARSAVISPDLIDNVVWVYSGRHWIPFMIQDSHVGFKFGCFVWTRMLPKKKRKKQLKTKK